MRRTFLIAAAAIVLSACTPMVALAPAGAYAVGDARVTLARDWSDVSTDKGGKVRLLTIDGPLLNRLYLSGGLVDGERLFTSKSATSPIYSATMSVREQVEFVVDSLAATGLERVTTPALRPVVINGERGVRFDVEGFDADGLMIRGRGQAVKANGRLYVAVYLAPAEHYYQADLASAEATMDSVQF
ncbi:hypothetical protein [Brevundimonas lenta]|uniref:Uncharacterized protein n=1 Tax=Brevundimonas lenta TaxID=424796 RepID=A0A7W6NQ28_9CAUL|nr:hypothetical protein [Brevundimonas lenta]MBB4084060.1 hypothetical protein [Brevundimonas lenta]